MSSLTSSSSEENAQFWTTLSHCSKSLSYEDDFATAETEKRKKKVIKKEFIPEKGKTNLKLAIQLSNNFEQMDTKLALAIRHENITSGARKQASIFTEIDTVLFFKVKQLRKTRLDSVHYIGSYLQNQLGKKRYKYKETNSSSNSYKPKLRSNNRSTEKFFAASIDRS